MEQMNKDKISLFWHRGDKVTPIRDSVAIHQIAHSDDVDGGSIGGVAVFRCKPSAEEFMLEPWGVVEVRYDCLPADNPGSGDLLCTINQIVPTMLAVSDLTTFEATSDELEFILSVECNISWEFIRIELEKYQDEED